MTNPTKTLTFACLEHMEAVRQYANEHGGVGSLEQNLAYLLTYAPQTSTRCTLYRGLGHETYDFDLVMERQNPETGEWAFWFNGGLICHDDGVNMVHWVVHT